MSSRDVRIVCPRPNWHERRLWMQINPRIIRTPASGYAVIAAMKRELCSSSGDIAWELGLLRLRIIDVFHDDLLHPYDFSRNAHLLQTIFHGACSLANGYISTLRMSSLHTSQIVRVRLVFLRPGTHYPHFTWAHVMLRVQLGCERRFDIEFFGADSHFCHSAYVTWSHVELW
jgi:hypothetical protein